MSHEKPDRTAEVLRLALLEGCSLRQISKKLSISRKTVRRILGRGAQLKQKVSATPRSSILDPYEDEIKKLLKDSPDLRATAVLERLRDQGYKGGITVLRDRLRMVRPRRAREAFLSLDFKPGSALQIDWADCGFALPGCPRRVSAFVAALAYSRYLYLEFTLSQAMGTFLRCMERCLEFFGGTTHTDIFDNMKTVVRERVGGIKAFNPRFAEYARSRGFAITVCTPHQPQQKGRVERPIGFVRERFWRGRRFQDLLDLNRQGAEWRDRFANNRVHEATGKIPSLVFEHEEKRHLKPRPVTPFDVDDIDTALVTKTFKIPFDRNLYSVPWRLAGQSVVIRGNDESVSVFLSTKEIARHARSWGIGETIEAPSHREGLLEERPRAAASSLPAALTDLGDLGRDYFKLLAANRHSIQKEIVRLVLLVELFGARNTRDAMAEVFKTGHVGAEYVEYVLRHRKGLSPSVPPLRLGDPALDAISFSEPDLSQYDQRNAKTRDPGTPAKAEEPDDEEE